MRWDQEKVLFCSKNYEPSPEMRKLLAKKQARIGNDISYDSVIQLYLPMKQALNLTLR